MTASKESVSAPSPVPLAIARSMLSLGIEASLAFWTASARAALPTTSPPPSFAATVIARASLVKSLPRRESTIAFLCLIPAHLLCPAMAFDSILGRHAPRRARRPRRGLRARPTGDHGPRPAERPARARPRLRHRRHRRGAEGPPGRRGGGSRARAG